MSGRRRITKLSKGIILIALPEGAIDWQNLDDQDDDHHDGGDHGGWVIGPHQGRPAMSAKEAWAWVYQVPDQAMMFPLTTQGKVPSSMEVSNQARFPHRGDSYRSPAGRESCRDPAGRGSCRDPAGR